MSIPSSVRASCVAFALACASVLPAHADLSIAKKPTRNVSCTGGSCVATGRHAVMNVTDLQSLLGTQPAVSLDAASAKNITVDAALTWTGNASLALTASGALTVNRPMTVAGHGSIAIHTVDFGLSFAPRASISFWDLSSGLAINNASYTLVSDIMTIVDDLDGHVAKAFAFANDHDASADTFPRGAPIPALMDADNHIEGLGHTISHLSVHGGGSWSGLIGASNGTLTNLRIANATLEGGNTIGIAIGYNQGVVDRVSVSGTVTNTTGSFEVGGLVGENYGTIRNSSARIRIPHGGTGYTGGLVGNNSGTVSDSWVDGYVTGSSSGADMHGGLAGFNPGTIDNSYSLANTRLCYTCKYNFGHGGLIGQTMDHPSWPSTVRASYAAGATALNPPFLDARGSGKKTSFVGGAVGYYADSTNESVYWVTDSSKHNPKWAAGNKAELPGVTGLTQAEMKAALPAGFDKKIWAQNPNINNGYPYLIANPPQ